jgi:membrane associated rhomboid family serine protease
MKIFIYLLLAISVFMLVFNLTNIDFSNPFQGDSSTAATCTLAAACVSVMLVILLISKRISEKVRQQS